MDAPADASFSERVKKAFDFASETTKQLITLSIGIIALTITFAKDILGSVPNFAKWLLMVSWFFYLVSVVSGLATLMALSGTLDPPTNDGDLLPPASIYAKNVRGKSGCQAISFLLATLMIIVAGIGIVSTNFAPTDNLSEEQAVRAVERELTGALLQRDATAIDRIIADDSMVASLDGVSANKMQVISFVQSGDLVCDSVGMPNPVIRIFGDIAWESGQANVKGRFKDRAFSGGFQYCALYVKRKGHWRAILLKASGPD